MTALSAYRGHIEKEVDRHSFGGGGGGRGRAGGSGGRGRGGGKGGRGGRWPKGKGEGGGKRGKGARGGKGGRGGRWPKGMVGRAADAWNVVHGESHASLRQLQVFTGDIPDASGCATHLRSNHPCILPCC